MNQVSLVLKRHYQWFEKTKNEFVLTAEKAKGTVIDNSGEVIREWFDAIKKKVCLKTATNRSNTLT